MRQGKNNREECRSKSEEEEREVNEVGGRDRDRTRMLVARGTRTEVIGRGQRGQQKSKRRRRGSGLERLMMRGIGNVTWSNVRGQEGAIEMIEGIGMRTDIVTGEGIDEKFRRHYSDSPLRRHLSYLRLLHLELPELVLDHSHLPFLVHRSLQSHHQRAVEEEGEAEEERFTSKSVEMLSSRHPQVSEANTEYRIGRRSWDTRSYL